MKELPRETLSGVRLHSLPFRMNHAMVLISLYIF
jgi:hypothetical protein